MKGHTELPVRDGLTDIDRLRLHVCDSDTFAFDLDDAESVINTYDDLADAATKLVKALEACQASLALMIEPKAIKSSTVMGAFTQAFEADCKARSALTHYRELAGTSNG